MNSTESEPVALIKSSPTTKISLKCEPMDTNAVPGTDSLTLRPVSSSNCNFVNCLLYVFPSTSEPDIKNGTFVKPNPLPVNSVAFIEPVTERLVFTFKPLWSIDAVDEPFAI